MKNIAEMKAGLTEKILLNGSGFYKNEYYILWRIVRHELPGNRQR